MGRLYVVGDLNVDLLASVDSIPKRGEEFHAREINFSVGGNAANFSFAVGRLGAEPILYSGIGRDFSSDYLSRELESSGVKLRLKKADCSNGYSIVMVLPGGERCIVSNKGASSILEPGDLAEILSDAGAGDIVYAGGLFHLPRLARGFSGFLKSAKKKGLTTMLDFTFDSRRCSDCFSEMSRSVDMLFLNEDETLRLGKGPMERSLKRISSMGVRDIIVKLGGKGSLFHVNGMTIKSPGIKVKAKDSTGAGDVFNAGFVYGFMKGLNSEQCLRLGNWVAAYKVQRSGLTVPPRNEVEEFIRKI